LLVLTLLAASPAAAQDQGLDLLLFAGLLDRSAGDVQAQTTQLYRIPLALPLRSTKDGRVGLRLTFPISLSSVRVQGVSDLTPFVRKLGVAALVPGIELQIPVGARLRLRPFAEAGLGRGNDAGKTEVLYGAGIRARVDHSNRRMRLTFGGSAMHRKRGTDGGRNDGHSMFEGAVDSQLPLGFSIGSKQARGGIYTIARGFSGLQLPRENQDPIELRSQFEAGLSFSTSPDLAVWKIKLPWLAAGYQFGKVISGVRVYMQFPF
jgi:hypothetical protein